MLKEKLKTNNKTNANAVGADDSVYPKKSANELIANVVGADDPVCPHFEENAKRTPKTHSNLISNLSSLTSDYKGITLIALIITIIVMLILVGVTISVALNGGLFKKANTAVTQTQKEVDRETLLSEVTASLNDNLEIPNLDALTSNLPNGWKAEGADGGPYTCTSPKGNIFTVTSKGEITDNNNSNESGANKKDYYIFTIGDLVDKGLFKGGFVFIDDNFWPDDVSEKLKNSSFVRNVNVNGLPDQVRTYNIKCLDQRFRNALDCTGMDLHDVPFTYTMLGVPESYDIYLAINGDVPASGGYVECIDSENYKPYAEVTFRIDLP